MLVATLTPKWGKNPGKKACFALSGYADGENEVHFGEKQEAIVVPLPMYVSGAALIAGHF